MQGKHFLINALLPRLIFLCVAFDAHATNLLRRKMTLCSQKVRSFRAIVYLLKIRRFLKGVAVIVIKDGNGRLQSFCNEIFNLAGAASDDFILFRVNAKYTSSDHIPGAIDVTNHISKTTHLVYWRSRRRCIDSTTWKPQTLKYISFLG
jgi:hypothetical protein